MSDILSSKSESVECQVKTKFVKHTYDFSWSIEDFPKYPATFFVTSPEFHPIKELSFYATLEATTLNGYKYNYLIFKFVQESGDPVEVSHSIVITDDKGSELLKKDSTTYKYESDDRKHCLYQGKDTEFVDQPILIFKCKMEFYVSSTNIVSKHPMPIPSEKSQNLVDDLRALCTDSLHADLCLQLKETSLLVHKGILCSRSPVFAKLLGPHEKEKEVIPIEDIELRVVGGFMEFLYTGVLSNDDFDFVYDLYSAADKYDVSSLRKTCTDVLLAKLDVENACRVLSLADRHSNVQFKDAVMDFIQSHFDDILQTNTWSEFVDCETKLAALVMQCRSQKYKKVKIYCTVTFDDFFKISPKVISATFAQARSK